ncbi:uncharacterized protein BDZ99DRAFT_466915 [Mytilinidion resinicola]|uniref:Outer spore wall protein RRT8 n=1 Tax=Mytilinidion resinicola TaxID=574789 RepID=A0A6A6Y9N8_9PEZI|nr:uncharacterized protein BDZ99DRAFT_466915 [Mytilinidion resinicola]KAF2805278.1 hypothetical protein BDZ99DRAFT_466915 [Mytilinidion resinicola]
MSEKVKQTALEEAQRVRVLATEAVQSRAYFYPLRGVPYFLTHRDLWKPLGSKIVPTMTLGLGITTAMFLVTYVPQAAVLALFNGPLAALTTILLVLSESSTLISVLSKNFLIDEVLIDTFDGTLIARNKTVLVSDGRQIEAGNGSDPISKLGKLIKKPFQRFTPTAVIRYFLYLPLNFIPVVGTVIFVALQGRKTGPAAHARYFQLKEMSKSEQSRYIEEKKAAYTAFGVVALLLEMIPLAGIFFAFTNTVGAALWAADLEDSKSTAPNLRDQAKKAE